MGSDGATEWMKRLREAPTMSGTPKPRHASSWAMQVEALLWRLAEADAGIERDALARDAGARGNGERALEERRHVGDDVDCGIGALAIVHDDDRARRARRRRAPCRGRAAGPRRR